MQQAIPLYQCVVRLSVELLESGGFRRPAEQEVIGRFVECGDPDHGFARIRCEDCG